MGKVRENRNMGVSSVETCVHYVFEAQTQRTPDSVAVVFQNETLTYRELNARANQVARFLCSLNVGPGVVVGICVERSIEMLVGTLGILKAGGAYVPLDPAYPCERVAFMVSDARIAVLLSQQHLVRKFNLDALALTISLDSDKERLLGQSQENPAHTVSPQDGAYVLFTSGTTGKPKGVAVPHGALANLLLEMRQLLAITEHDSFLALTTLSFDIAAVELFLPLLVGACTIIVRHEKTLNAKDLSADLAHHPITFMQATPTAWRLLLDSGWTGGPHVKIISGGEALPRSLAHALLNHCACLWNGYGPTEATIYSTAFRVTPGEGPVPIGYPLAGAQLHVLDDQLRPVAYGETGELCIGGPGVTRGYLNRPELTAERFIPDPFISSPQARLYKTGDLVRYQPDGALQYLGRKDRQIKLRGLRIEPGEIEEVLRGCPSLQDARVVAHSFGQEDWRLVAYIICRPGYSLRLLDIRAQARLWLPNYMLPAAYIPLQAFPLLPNGKVDYRALPDPVHQRTMSREQAIPAASPIEEVLAAIWSEVLQGPVGSVDESFFDLGGNSLLVARVIARVQAAFNVDLPLSALFEAPTLAEFSSIVQEALGEGYDTPPASGSRTGEAVYTPAIAGL